MFLQKIMIADAAIARLKIAAFRIEQVASEEVKL